MTKFRNDIQSIRALCLVAIYIYHCNKKYLYSGFIGVDILFFISSYVNALSIKRKEKLYVMEYYCHRAVRLLPLSWISIMFALYIVSFYNIVYRKKLYLDILFADWSLANYRFVYLSTDYLSNSEKPSIVIHFWSLSLEEQFYLIFPFIINTLLYNNSFYIVILILSYLYSVLSWYHYPSFSYFDFFSRVWEFLYGIILHKVDKKKKINIDGNILILLVISLFFIKNIDKISPPFSIISLSITLLILHNENHDYFFSITFFHHLGNVSYCFYLFHYIFINILFKSKNEYISISICFIFTYIISYFLTFYYEIPIRNKLKSIYYQICFIIFMQSMLLFIIAKILKNDYSKLKKINRNNLSMTYNDVKYEWRRIFSRRAECPFENRRNKFVEYKDVALFITDSHVEQWFNVIMPYISSNNYIPVHIYAREWNVLNNNLKIIKKLLDRFILLKVIIIGYIIESKVIGLRKLYFENYVRLLLNYTKLLYIFQDTPHFLNNPYECLNLAKDYDNCFAILGINATINMLPIIKDKRIRYINMNDFICNRNKYCYFIINKKLVYRDDNHISIQFADSLSKYLLKEFKIPKIDIINNKSNRWLTCMDFFLLNSGKIKENKISWY